MTIFFPKHYGLDDVHHWFRQHGYSTFYVADFYKSLTGLVFTFKP